MDRSPDFYKEHTADVTGQQRMLPPLWHLVLPISFVQVRVCSYNVRGQCNLEGAQVCLANISIPDQNTQDIREACQ
uniref:Uncharacterized protein n=1 Tax=Magallana gigas TaxID=29159 RepID=K1QIH0_MAGGI